MPKSVNNLSTFRSQFDPEVVVPAKINAALAAMLKEGEETWDYELDFMKRAKLSSPAIAAYRSKFEKHVVEVRTANNMKRVWFASTKVAAKARGE